MGSLSSEENMEVKNYTPTAAKPRSIPPIIPTFCRPTFGRSVNDGPTGQSSFYEPVRKVIL